MISFKTTLRSDMQWNTSYCIPANPLRFTPTTALFDFVSLELHLVILALYN